MKTATVVAILGGVEANRLVEKAHHACPFAEFMKDLTPKCTARDTSKDMPHYDFWRKTTYTVLNSGIKGFYHDHRENPLDEKCMGDWMDVPHKKVHETFHKIHHGGLWDVSLTEVKQATDSAWDMLYSNMEYCGFERAIWNKYNWCMNNIETCFYHDGFHARMQENAMQLVGDGFKLFNLLTEDDSCYSDNQLIEEVGNYVVSLVDILSYAKGFEGKWSNDSEFEKLTHHQMWENIKAKKATLPHRACPFQGLIKGWKNLMHHTPIHAHHKKHHNKHHNKHHKKHATHNAWKMPVFNPFKLFTPWNPVHHKQQQSPLFFNSFPVPMQGFEMSQMKMPVMKMPELQMPHLF